MELNEAPQDKTFHLDGPVAEAAGPVVSLTLRPLPQEDATITAIIEEGERSVARAKGLQVVDAETDKLASDDLGIVAGIKHRVGEKKKEYTGPVRMLLADINGIFDRILEPITEADTILRGKHQAYVVEQRRQEEQQNRIVRLQAEAADAKRALEDDGVEVPELEAIEVEVVPAPERTRGKSGALVSTTKKRKARVVDFAALSDDYKVADMVTLNALAKNRKGENPPKGVEFYIEEGIQVRR